MRRCWRSRNAREYDSASKNLNALVDEIGDNPKTRAIA